MLAGHVLCGRPVDAANRAFCQRSQRGRGRMPPPRRVFYQRRQSDRNHHAAAAGAQFASPPSTWISDPVMYDDSSASRTGPRRTRLRRDDANEAHRHRRARARRRWRRPIRLNRQQRRYLCLSTPTPRSVSVHSTGCRPLPRARSATSARAGRSQKPVLPMTCASSTRWRSVPPTIIRNSPRSGAELP